MNVQGNPDVVNILLVDDRPSNLTSLEAVLRRPDYRLVLARSGEAALAEVLREEFAVILLDVAMPRLDGVETARLIKRRERSRHIPILFVTASVHDMASITQAYEAGAVDYLQKPVEPSLVRAKVAVFVELYRQRKEIERQAELLRESEKRDQEHQLRRKQAERQRFLDEVSSALMDSLDPERSLRSAAELTVPRLADVSAIYTVEERRVVQAAWSGDTDAFRTAFASLGQTPLTPGGRHPLMRALLDGVPRVEERVSPDFLASIAENDEQLRHLERLELGSLIFVPLRARGSVTGGFLLARHKDRGPFGEEDASLAEEVARRTAISLENARLYAKAREAVLIRDEFLSVASHELRTPLSALQLYLQGLEKLWRDSSEGPANDPALKKLEGAIRQTGRLARLTASLLDVSRIATGRLELSRAPVDMAEVVQDVVERFRPEAARVGSELELQIEGHATGVWDRLRIEQVFDNLLSNALKYGAGKPVKVTAGASEGFAILTVKDQGVGISPEDLKRIFGRFERAVPLRHYGGLGLGLYIAREILEAHGGRIVVDSAFGEGSTFRVELPIAETQSEAQPAPDASAASS